MSDTKPTPLDLRTPKRYQRDGAYVRSDRLYEEVMGNLYRRGIARTHLTTAKVKPFVQVNPHPNPFTPRGEPRWVAKCPECPGAEVVPAEGLFVCGSCGVEAEVDWSDT